MSLSFEIHESVFPTTDLSPAKHRVWQQYSLVGQTHLFIVMSQVLLSPHHASADSDCINQLMMLAGS